MEGAVQALHELPNGIMISIVGGTGLYGNGQSSFEMAAWHKGNPEFIMLSENDEILGWQSKEEIEELNSLEEEDESDEIEPLENE
jgi:hypothetical protein